MLKNTMLDSKTPYVTGDCKNAVKYVHMCAHTCMCTFPVNFETNLLQTIWIAIYNYSKMKRNLTPVNERVRELAVWFQKHSSASIVNNILWQVYVLCGPKQMKDFENVNY